MQMPMLGSNEEKFHPSLSSENGDAFNDMNE